MYQVKKKKKKWIILGIIVIAAVVVAFMVFSKKEKVIPSVQASALQQTSLSDIVSTNGVVQSTGSVNVYTSLNYSVQSVGVKVGDRVKVGDVLCKLDTKDLIDTIALKETSLRLSTAASSLKIKMSEKKYGDTKSNLDAGLNAQINAAQNQVEAAKRDLQNTQQKQAVAQRKIKEDLDAALISANANVDTASINLSRAQKNYDDAKKHKKEGNYDNEDAMDAEIKTNRERLTDAQGAYENAQKNLKATKAASDEQLLEYQNAVDAAQANYNTALKSLDAVQTSVNQDLQDAQAGIASDKLSADDTVQRAELASLRTKLAQCTVTAPAAGTITAVYATANAPASGLLFVIEDTAGLKLAIKIQDYDVANVKVGMNAIVKCDAIGNRTFEGIVQKISPAAVKGANGTAATGGNAEFEADVLITTKDTGLLIGMNGKTDIILEKREAVFAVPYDAVTTDPQGKSQIMIAKKQPDGTYLAQAIPVTTGIETDSEVQVSGDGLTAGLQVISDSKQVTAGQVVSIAGAADASATGAAGMRAEGTAQ
jgi:multidrug efflux pump subunit AcrA (membrane-fusion protein)